MDRGTTFTVLLPWAGPPTGAEALDPADHRLENLRAGA